MFGRYWNWIACLLLSMGAAGLWSCSSGTTSIESNSSGPQDADAAPHDATDDTTEDASSCDADTDATLWTVREDPSATLIAPKSTSPVTIDASLDEAAYLPATRLSFLDVADAEGGSDDQIDAYAVWDETELVVAMRVTDPTVETAPGEHPSQSDGVEIFLDTRQDTTDEMSDDVFHWVLGVEQAPQLKRADQVDSTVDFDSAVATTEDGYVVELRVSFDQLSFAPQVGSRLGVLLVGNDRDDDVSRQFSWGGVRPFKTPGAWGDLRLAPSAAAICDGSTGGGQDAGADADAGAEDTGSDAGVDASPDSGSTSPDPCCNPELAAQQHPACLGAQFDTVLDAVADLGMDASGGDSVEDIIEQHAADNTLIVFPDGTYSVDRFSLSGLENFGMVAAKGASPTFVPARPRDDMGEVILSTSGLKNFVFAGIDFDYTREGYGGRLYINGDGVVCGVEMQGPFPHDSKGFRVEVREPDATLLLDRVVIDGRPEQTGDDTNGIYVGNPHAGTIIIRDTRIENCTNNGIYASSPGSPDGGNGPVIVEGGVYKNNNIANVRIGSSGSIVRDVTVIVDETVPVFNGARNSRGIRVRDRKDQLIENCDIYYGPDGSSGSGAIAIHKEAGRVRVRNTRIKIDKDNQPAIRAKSPVTSNDGGPVLENVSITGQASGDRAVLISDRQDSQITDLCIHQTGADRDGVVLSNSNGGEIVDAMINVTGEPIVQSNSSIDVQNLSTDGTCPEPVLTP